MFYFNCALLLLFIINAAKEVTFTSLSLVESYHMTQCYKCLSLKTSVINGRYQQINNRSTVDKLTLRLITMHMVE